MSSWLGLLLHQLSPLIAAVSAVLVGWLTYVQGRKKSAPEEWQALYNEMRNRAETAEAENNELRNKVDAYHAKYGDL